jgi:Arylsulfotransferase (ASST)
VFPFPNTHYDLPGTQIVFRGIPASAIGPIAVTGSKTGPHTGRIEADSDGDGGSFLPDKPFAAGERVTVATHLDLVGAAAGTFSFQIAQPAAPIPYSRLPLVPAGSNGVQRFRSRPDLQPAALTVTKDSAPASNGDIFVAPQFGPTQDGPMILDPSGQLIWFDPFPVGVNTLITDFREQQLFGQPVLTWWQGNTNAGTGRGEGVILNTDYQRIATVHAAEGLDMDLHEFMVTPNGDAYFAADSALHVPGVSKTTIDSVIQEVDIRTGLVLFEWHALDHVAQSESDFTPKTSANPFDPFHLNSISLDQDGNLIVSMRNTSAIYKIDHTTGQIIWRLGGKRSSFKMGRDTSTWEQHDAVIQPDGTLTVFDDGGAPGSSTRTRAGFASGLTPPS